MIPINLFNSLIIFCLILPKLISQDTSRSEYPIEQSQTDFQANFYRIGQSISTRIVKDNWNENVYQFNVGKIEKKYIFMRVLSNQVISNLIIKVYDYSSGKNIFQCKFRTSDSCYLRSQILKENQKIYFHIKADNQVSFLLQTYWGNLQHIYPGQKIEFLFSQQNSTQLFHLDLDDDSKFSQIRLMLKPKTPLSSLDSIKMYANYGTQKQPTQQQHDVQSQRVWGDSQAIFLKKQQLKGKSGLNIFIVGSSQVIYILSCEVISRNNHEIEINQHIQQYIQANQSKVYSLSLNSITQQNLQYLVLKLSIFTGQIQTHFYYDQNLTQQYKGSPMSYMNDMQFFLSYDILKVTQTMYIKIECPDASSAYKLSVRPQQQGQSYQIQQSIYQFVHVNSISKVLHYQYEIFQKVGQQKQKKQILITFYELLWHSNLSIRYYTCKSTKDQQCYNPEQNNFAKITSEIMPISSQQIGQQIVKKFVIEQQQFIKQPPLSKKLTIILVIKNQEINKSPIIAIKVSNSDKIQTLRDDRALTDKILKQQTKLYRYINSNPSIQRIKIFFSQISGNVEIKAYRTDPRTLSDKQKLSIDKLDFTEDVTSPIFIEVKGLINSIYSLSVGITHKQHPFTASLTLDENIEYTLQLEPFSFINIKLQPIGRQIQFAFDSEGGYIRICQLQDQQIIECKNQTQITDNKGKMRIKAQNDKRKIPLRIMNYPTHLYNEKQNENANKYAVPRRVQVRVIFHQIENKHCQLRHINKLYSQSLKSGQCLKFNIIQFKNIDIMTRHPLTDQFAQEYRLCNKTIYPSYSSNRGRNKIKKNDIKQICQSENDIVLEVQFSEKQIPYFKVQYSIQLQNQPVQLEDGVAYQARSRTLNQQDIIRTFYYPINQISSQISVYLHNLKGKTKINAYITSKSNNYKPAVNNITTIDSLQRDHSLSPRFKVSTDEISRVSCQNNCILVLSVVTIDQIGSSLQFSIIVAQNSLNLRQDETYENFVSQNQFQYYQYYKNTNDTSLTISLSDNNLNCANLYLSRYQFPTSSTSIKQSSDGMLINQQSPQGRYYIGVEGKSECVYSIVISQSRSIITKLYSGHFYDFSLKTNETKTFLYRHYSQHSFKVVTLLRWGNLHIYAKKIAHNSINFKQNPSIDEFGPQSLHPNVLQITEDNQIFCNSCYYLIAIQGEQPVEGSLVVTTNSSQVKLTGTKIIYDQLQKDEVLILNRYPVTSGNFSVKVISGKIQIKLTYHDIVSDLFIFATSKQSQVQSYSFQAISEDKDPIKVQIKSIENNSVFSFHFLSQDLQKKLISSGRFQSFILPMQGQLCVEGWVRDKNDEIIISVNKQDKFIINKLKHRINLSQKEANERFNITRYQNIIELKFQSPTVFFTKKFPYQLCLWSSQPLEQVPITIYQSGSINLLPPETQILVKNNQKYMIHSSTSSALIDLFQCNGKAKIKYTTEDSSLDNKKDYGTQILGMPRQNHVIRLTDSQLFILSIQSAQATLRWRPIDYQKQQGIGYFKYSEGTIKYETDITNILFKIQGIRKIQETNLQIVHAEYNLFISDNIQHLSEQTNCQKFDLQRNRLKMKETVVSEDNKVQENLQISIKKKQIQKVFKQQQQIYFSLVADIVLKNSESKLENYRLFYPTQQIPALVFKDGSIYTNLFQISAFVIGALIILAVLIILVFKIMFPTIARLRNRVWVSDQISSHHNNHQVIGTISQRPQIEPQNTQEQMSK